MLVLSRKVGEELVIGDNIRLVINHIAGNRVTVGIVAPQDVHVIRGELKSIREGFEDDGSHPAAPAKAVAGRLAGAKRVTVDNRPSILAFSSTR